MPMNLMDATLWSTFKDLILDLQLVEVRFLKQVA
jgi:hypothetical protein